ncbi:MAG: prepilin-type N-terminal cleavage/methylation domain-containing protein [Candidatus Saccharimonadales bacterium]
MVDRRKKDGFTIVELLIVIVVIGILATITIVSYNGVQKRANDTKRVSDINALSKGMTMWAVQTDKTPIDTAAGYNGNGTGWVYSGAFAGDNGAYTTDIESVLIDAQLLSPGVRDPKTPTGNGSYMFYRCNYTTKTSLYGFFARLESPQSAPSNDFARWSTEGCIGSPLSSQYGMNYAKLFTYE